MASAFNLAKAESNFEELVERLLFEVKETELTPEKRRERRRAADTDPLVFARTYFAKVFTDEFNAVHHHIAALEKGKYSVSGFPQSGKSAITYLGLGMWKIAMGMGGIMLCGARELPTATNATRRFARIIKKHALLRYDYQLEIIQDSAGDYIFKSENGTTHVQAGSVSTGVRNKTDDEFNRIKFAILDDLYNKESVRSEPDNQRVFEWVTGEVDRQMEYDGLRIMLGNSINEGCPVNLVKAHSPDTHFSFPIIGDEEESNWPERLSAEMIEALKADTPSDIWFSEYLDDPLEVGEEFDADWLRTINVNRLEILATITAIDPSYGQSPNACFKGAAELAILSDHRCVLTDIYIRKDGYEQFFYYLRERAQLAKKHKAFLFENDFAQWEMAKPYYDAWLKKEKTPLAIVLHNAKDLKTKHRAADKDSRILTLVHPHLTGMFLYSEEITGSSDYELYRRQYLGYGNQGKKKKKGKKKDDGLDAVATAYIMIRHYIETERFKGVGRRKRERPTWEKGGWH